MKRRLLIVALVISALTVWEATRLELALDISSFMLGQAADSLPVKVSKKLARGEASRTLTLLVEAPDTETALSVSRTFESALLAEPSVARLTGSLLGGPPTGAEEALWQLYSKRNLSFVATSSAAVEAATSSAAVAQALDRWLERLSEPGAAFLGRVLPTDPLFVLPRRFEALGRSGHLSVVAGRFLDREQRQAALFLRSKRSAFDGEASGQLLSGIRQVFDRLPEAKGCSLRMAGLHRFSVQVERSIRDDIQRVSTVSILGVVLIFLLVFRSPRILGVTWAVLHIGFTVGLGATMVVYGEVHGLTLAFGASLIGVAIDYTIHFFVHHTVEDGDPKALLTGLWPGLALGAATTVAGFVALGASSLPGLGQVALFSAAGLTGSLFATRLAPDLAPVQPHRSTARLLAERLDAGLRSLRSQGRWLWIAPLIVLGVAAVGVPRLRWADDLRRMTALDPALVVEEEAVRAAVSPYEKSRFVVALGPDEEAALQMNDRVAEQLELARADGILGGYRSLAAFLPSARTQNEVAERVRGEPALPPRVRRLAESRGFSKDAFEPFFERLKAPLPSPIDYLTFSTSPLGQVASAFRIEVDPGTERAVGFVTFVRDVRDPRALASRFEKDPRVVWFDQATAFRETNLRYLSNTAAGLAVGALVVLGLVVFRYRRADRVGRALLPAGLGIAFTLGMLGLLGHPLSIVGLTALLMVFSMGVDYGVFMTEAEPGEGAAPLLGIVLAGVSTVVGFGLLALSSHPAMRSIGLVAGLGVSASALLAPIAATLFSERGDG